MRSPLITLPTLLLLVAGSVSVARAEQPWTLSAHLGDADLDGFTKGASGFLGQIDDDNVSLGISLAYEIAPFLGVRAMYEHANGFDMRNSCAPGYSCAAVFITDRADLDSWTLAALPRYHLNDQWSVYGILGVWIWDIDTDGVLPSGSGSEFTAGAGIAWRPSSRIEVGVEYQHANFDYDALRLNLGVRF